MHVLNTSFYFSVCPVFCFIFAFLIVCFILSVFICHVGFQLLVNFLAPMISLFLCMTKDLGPQNVMDLPPPPPTCILDRSIYVIISDLLDIRPLR